jgi:hypothetical protein
MGLLAPRANYRWKPRGLPQADRPFNYAGIKVKEPVQIQKILRIFTGKIKLFMSQLKPQVSPHKNKSDCAVPYFSDTANVRICPFGTPSQNHKC